MKSIFTKPAFLALASCAAQVLALPDFQGPLPTDRAIYTGIRDEAHAKNVNVGIPDIENVALAPDEMLIRFYIGFGEMIYQRGSPGHPLVLQELRVSDAGDLDLFQYPPCSRFPEASLSIPDDAWTAVQREDLFTIRDSASYSDYPSVRDGVAYFVQIKTAAAFREFLISNPDYYPRGDNPRFMAIVAALADEFAQPAACYRTN